MDIFEFELRYLSYTWFNRIYQQNRTEDEIVNLVKITNKGQLDKKLTETTPEEIKQLTYESYTQYKKDFLGKRWDQEIKNHTLREYIDRLEYELKVIKEMWYNTYFLIVQDYIIRAKKNNISVGPWRWSWWWSFLSFVIWITDIDPMEYELFFERFLNPARVSMPDIDTDFEDSQRDEVVEYVKQKYWSEKVATIWTYMTMAAKAAFKDVARAMWIPFEQANKISWYITEKTIPKSIEENEEFQEFLDQNEEMKKITDLASKLEWTVRQIGVHACGVVIAPGETQKFTPIEHPPLAGWKKEKDTTRKITQYDGHFLEDIGLLKMDFLWLRNLTIIKNTIKIIKAKKESEWKEVEQIFKDYFDYMWFYPPLDDQKTYETTFQQWETSWVFQFESDGMRAWLRKLKPTDINDIIAMVSLYRPGPMDFIPSYVARKHGEEKIKYLPDDEYNHIKEKYWEEVAKQQKQQLTNDLCEIMDITYWIPIYQEQLMRIVQAVAGFSLAEADMLRRWVGKKIKEVIEKLKKQFIERAMERWYKEETCNYVYEKMIEPAANYSFNKSHATCYSMIAYQTAYLKAHYPLEFHAAHLRSVEEETDKLAKFIDELKIKWFNITIPSVNKSFVHVAAIWEEINLWFLAIKWAGYEVAKTIQEERQNNWKFTSLQNFLERCNSVINKKSLEALAKSGSLDELEDRLVILENMDEILKRTKDTQEASSGGGLFDVQTLQNDLKLTNPKKWSILDKLLYEEEIFKAFVSAHIFDWLYPFIKKKFNLISMIKDVEDYGNFKTLAFIKDIKKLRKAGNFVTIEDISWTTEIFIKELLDLKKYDIIIIEWEKFKWRTRIKKITKTSLDELTNRAKKSNQYNPEETVDNVRHKRNNNIEDDNKTTSSMPKIKDPLE